MFSIQLAAPKAPEAARPGLGRRLVGKAIGFAAGLTLIVAVDAFFFHHMVWQSFSDTFALHQPTLEHAARAAWAKLALR